MSEKTKRELILEDEISGEISIGSGEYLNSRLLARILTSFREKHPGVKYEIYSGNSDNIKERIERGVLDIGFLLEPVDIRKYEFVRSPVREEWGVLVSEDSDLALREHVEPKDLAFRSLILSDREMIKGELVNWFGEYADKLNIIAGGNLPYNMAALGRENMGVFLNLKLNCSYEGMNYIPLYPVLISNTVLAWKKNQTMSHAADALVDFIKEYIKCMDNDEI